MRKGWIAIAIGLILIGLGGAAFYKFHFSEPLSAHSQEWTFASNELHTLKISNESRRTDVKFIASTDGRNSIRLQGKAEQEIIDRLKNTTIQDGNLDLNFNTKSKWFSINLNFNFGSQDKQEIIVALADSSALDDLIVKSDAGSVYVNGSAVKTADLSSASGSVHVTNFTGDSLTVKTDSGSIHGEQIRAKTQASSASGSIQLNALTGPVQLKTDSGSVRLVKNDTTDSSIKTDSGSVRVQLTQAFTGFYELKSDSGSIHAPDSPGQTTERFKVQTDSGSIRIENK